MTMAKNDFYNSLLDDGDCEDDDNCEYIEEDNEEENTL